MSTFDFINNKIVGYVEILPIGHAYIEVVGYCEERNDFFKLTESEITELFPPNGRVFAHNFANRYSGMKGHLVCLSIKESERGEDHWAKYIWDKSEVVDEYGYKLTSIYGNILEDGEHNYNVFVENDLIESVIEKFVISEGKVYHIKANSIERIISYWYELNLDLIQIQGEKFMPGFFLPPYDGAIDITTDDQLIDWYISRILKKKWAEILKNQNFKFAEPYIKEVLLSLKGIDNTILENRMNRLKSINMNFVLTLEELQHISDSPWLSNAIDKSIAKYNQEYLSSIRKESEEELNLIKNEYNILIVAERERLEKEMASIADTVKFKKEELKKRKALSLHQ